MQIEIHSGTEQAREYSRYFCRHAVPRHAGRDKSVVVRPHAADVVAHRVVTRLAGTDSTDAPSREQIWLEKRLHYFYGARSPSTQHLDA